MTALCKVQGVPVSVKYEVTSDTITILQPSPLTLTDEDITRIEHLLQAYHCKPRAEWRLHTDSAEGHPAPYRYIDDFELEETQRRHKAK